MQTREKEGGTVTVAKAAVVSAFVEAVCGGDECKARALRVRLGGVPLRAAAQAGPVDVKTLARVEELYLAAVARLSETVRSGAKRTNAGSEAARTRACGSGGEGSGLG